MHRQSVACGRWRIRRPNAPARTEQDGVSGRRANTALQTRGYGSGLGCCLCARSRKDGFPVMREEILGGISFTCLTLSGECAIINSAMVTKKQMRAAEEERALIRHEKMTGKKWLVLITAVFASGLFRAIGVYSFIVPNHFAPGGVTGIASMLEFGTKINAGYFLAAINIPLIVIAFIFIGKRFSIISGIAILLSSGLMIVFEYIPHFPRLVADTYGADRILFAVAGGILNGTGGAIIIKVGGSSGGTDIVATLIQKKYSATNIAWFIFLLDSTVVIASGFVYGNLSELRQALVPILLAFVEMFTSGKVMETILQGFKSALKFEIITSHPEELSQEIITKLHRGVTSVTAKGMYTGEERAMLICVLRKRELSQFRAILKKYPDSFAYIGNTSEVVGRGFTD